MARTAATTTAKTGGKTGKGKSGGKSGGKAKARRIAAETALGGGTLRALAATRSKKNPPPPRAGDCNGHAGRPTPAKTYDPGASERGQDRISGAISRVHERDNGRAIPVPHWERLRDLGGDLGLDLAGTTHKPDRAHSTRDLTGDAKLLPARQVPGATPRLYPACQFDPRGRTAEQVEDLIYDLAQRLEGIAGLGNGPTMAAITDAALGRRFCDRPDPQRGLRGLIEKQTKCWDPVNRVWVHDDQSVEEAIRDREKGVGKNLACSALPVEGMSKSCI